MHTQYVQHTFGQCVADMKENEREREKEREQERDRYIFDAKKTKIMHGETTAINDRLFEQRKYSIRAQKIPQHTERTNQYNKF